MQIESVNRRTAPTLLSFQGQTMKSGIHKVPTPERLMMTEDGLEGDTIVDKRYHGGRYKAIYSYAAEDYERWRHNYRPDLPYGAFGENLTTRGLDESEVCIGDRIRIGEALLQVSEPRTPCKTLGMHMQDMTIIKRFWNQGRFGIYFQVIEPGSVQVGDAVALVSRDPAGVPVTEITRLYGRDKNDAAGLQRVLQVASLPPDWRGVFEDQLAELDGIQSGLFSPDSGTL